MKSTLHRLNWHEGVELLDVSFRGSPFAKHSHDAFAIGVIECGVGGNFHRGEKKVLPPNTLSLMNPDELHDGFSISESLKYKVLYVDEASMRHLTGHKVNHGFRDNAATDVDGLVASSLTRIQTRLSAKGHAGWRLAVDSDLTYMLERVMLRHSVNRSGRVGAEPHAIAVVKDYLNGLNTHQLDGSTSGSGESVTLKSLADLVQLKPNYLLNIFTQAVGMPPYAYWMARRVGIAKRLLAQGWSIARVAQELGFYDQSHFSRTFKNNTGVTPGQLIGH
jgi:AraC-like DNA-binding protein